MTKREFLDTVFALAPNEANAIMDAFDEYVDSNEPHWIPVTERLPDNSRNVLITRRGGVSVAWYNGSYFENGANTHHRKMQTVTAWCELPEPYKGVSDGRF
jgi:hypothetical protein